MAKSRSKIGLLFFGGSGIQTGDGRIVEVTKKDEISLWMNELPELAILADIEAVFIFGGPPSEVTPVLWEQLVKTIGEIYPTVDGIVVTHGIDTVVYTGALLSFMLGGLGKPIVLTSSPLMKDMEGPSDLQGMVSDYRNLGVRANLINAVQVATMDLAEVVIMHGNRVLRANQTIKSIGPGQNFFEAIGEGVVGRVDFGIKLFDHVLPRKKGKLNISSKLDDHICTMRIHPASNPEQIGRMIASGCRAILLRTYSTVPYPRSFVPYLRLAKEKSIPVIAHNLFALHKSRDDEEYILVNDMTYEATLTKCMWLLGQAKNPQEFRKLLHFDKAREHILQPV